MKTPKRTSKGVVAAKAPPRLLPTCGNCVFFMDGPADGVGLCRRYPPTLIMTAGGAVSTWPSVLVEHWCGEQAIACDLAK